MAIPFGGRLALVATALGFAAAARAEDWPRWRGPRQDGISRETGLLRSWPEGGPRKLWSAALSGGFSSFAVAGGRLFTQTKQGKEEIVLCLDAATGKELWRYAYACDYAAHPTFTGGGMPASRTGPRATPAVEGGRVYALGATGTLLCLDADTGKKVWQQDLLKLAGRACPSHGYCGSPLVAGDRVYLQVGGPRGKSVAALNKQDGGVAWQALDDPIGEATPLWAELGGTGQVIFFTGAGAVGLTPDDGKFLWRYPWTTRYNLHIATPICADGLVFISSDYGTGAAVFRPRAGGDAETLWKGPAMQSHISTPVLYEGHLYGASESRLRCVDFTTGKIRWDQAGLGRCALVVADGHLIIQGDRGQLALAKAGPEGYAEVSRCQPFEERTLTWTAPVLSDGRLFVRSENRLLALDLRDSAK